MKFRSVSKIGINVGNYKKIKIFEGKRGKLWKKRGKKGEQEEKKRKYYIWITGSKYLCTSIVPAISIARISTSRSYFKKLNFSSSLLTRWSLGGWKCASGVWKSGFKMRKTRVKTADLGQNQDVHKCIAKHHLDILRYPLQGGTNGELYDQKLI